MKKLFLQKKNHQAYQSNKQRNNTFLMQCLKQKINEQQQQKQKGSKTHQNVNIQERQSSNDCKRNSDSQKVSMARLLKEWALIQTTQVIKSKSKSITSSGQPCNTEGLQAQLLSFEIDLKCQILGKVCKHPSRTNKCPFTCIVQLQALKQFQICGCGRQVEKLENQISSDWVLQKLIQFKMNSEDQLSQSMTKWLGKVQIDLQKPDFKFINNPINKK